MNTHDQVHLRQASTDHHHQVLTILFIVFGSFVLGLIPILYGMTFSGSGNLVPSEMTPWSVLGEETP